ncbi:MAG: hypothetical protein JWM68_1396 [Verrucomicrobiales bacterium]|nr:hypothetical protein [Verrucomicrobiales bacterium]
MKKQAIVLIHGVGEQIPMDTLRGFTEAVWTTDPCASTKGAKIWSKPDDISKDYELRRLTTNDNVDHKQTDFFEFYWAHMLEDTSLSHVGAWLKALLFRRPSRVPKQLLGIWTLLWILSLGTVIGFAQYKFHVFSETDLPVNYPGILLFLDALIVAGISWGLVKIAGDAARYLHVAPSNIASRKNIRAAGVELLQRLHASPEYDRIIVVGHSLGTMIGYDILTHLWASYNQSHLSAGVKDPTLNVKLAALQAEANKAEENSFDINKYQAAQAAYLKELQTNGNGWRVTDFVTLGSPLAHATVLMAKDKTELDEKKDQREFPACPPINETDRKSGKRQFWFRHPTNEVPIPHHAAVFAPTRWTNLYFPCRMTLWGDLIGGPVQPVFGKGVRDVRVKTKIWWGIFSHTFYWKFKNESEKKAAPEPIVELRKALRLYGVEDSPIEKLKVPDGTKTENDKA